MLGTEGLLSSVFSSVSDRRLHQASQWRHTHWKVGVMLERVEEKKPQKGGGKKRRHPGEEGEGGQKKRKGGEEGRKGQGDGGKKRLDALSVGYFRRVGERLGEGFEEDEERGERGCLFFLCQEHQCLERNTGMSNWWVTFFKFSPSVPSLVSLNL